MMPAMADRCMGRWAAEALPRPIQIGPKRPRFSAIASGSAQHLFRLSQVNRRSVVVSVVLAMAATAPRSPAAVAGANRDPQASLEAPWGFQARSVARLLGCSLALAVPAVWGLLATNPASWIGFDRNRLDRIGSEQNGFDRNGFDRNGFDRNSWAAAVPDQLRSRIVAAPHRSDPCPETQLSLAAPASALPLQPSRWAVQASSWRNPCSSSTGTPRLSALLSLLPASLPAST
jgi:hypothetical protein